MKKIGIVTIYYGSTNYGGNLQAYALPFFLNKLGYDAKQISYQLYCEDSGESLRARLISKFKQSPIKCVKAVISTIFNKIKDLAHKKDLQNISVFRKNRAKAFQNFQLNLIPHTEDTYSDVQLIKTNDVFDIFITGSDQVFNFNLYKPGYFLNFVSDNKTKFSYAASMALNEIPEDKKHFMRQTLSKYSAVSVREEKTQELLNELNVKDVKLVVDPTLLLDSSDWDKVASVRVVHKKYALCYFLGNNSIERSMAKEYAQKNDLTLVNIPTLIKKYKIVDLKFGDINLPYASPEDFISLIKYADCVFTDSFHACVFSLIYNKQFVVFNRDSKASMSSRIVSLMNVFGTTDRYIQNDKTNTIENVALALHGDTSYNSEKFNQLKELSINFLKENIK